MAREAVRGSLHPAAGFIASVKVTTPICLREPFLREFALNMGRAALSETPLMKRNSRALPCPRDFGSDPVA